MAQLKSVYLIFTVCCLHLFAPVVCCQDFDIDLLKSINPQYPSSGFWKATSSSYVIVSGGVAAGCVAYALIKKDKDLQHNAVEIVIGLGINVIVTDVVKSIAKRTRPYITYPNDVFILSTSKGYSFPSGHTSLAFATATSLTLTYKKWYIAVPAYLWAGCVGYSRMYLGKHYPSDVLGGAVVGAGSSLVSHWLSDKLFKQKQVSTHQPFTQ